MMKKTVILLIGLAMVFGMTGCLNITIEGSVPGIGAIRERAADPEDTALQENVSGPEDVSHETVAQDGTRLSDDSSDFVLLSEAVPDAILEIRYYSTYNFVGDRIDGYEEPLALLTREAAAALKEVSDDLKDKGYRLKIFDAYRPQMAVTNFMEWSLDPEDTRMKEYFYPELPKEVLFEQGYIAEHSGHSRGSTVDLTLFDMRTEKEVDMGGTFDYFGELSHPDYTGITGEQYDNRMLLREAMLSHGFKPLEEEWWHFTLADEPYPDTYFTFPINSDSVADLSVSAKETAGALSDPIALQESPAWVPALGEEKKAEQLFVVAGAGDTTAYVSMHEKDENGVWREIITTPGYIGKEGLGKTKEGDLKTPVGTFRFNYAFGIADDPGCAIPYHKADDDDYWSGDQREGFRYNEMVSLSELPELNKEDSEHITDYTYQYQYCLNISWNEEGEAGKGSAIFLHCLGPYKPFTGGCVAIPGDQMLKVMKNVREDCVVVIDSLENISPETCSEWGL